MKSTYGSEPQRSFPDDASEAAFLVGGIGTGCFSIGARGDLRDWEIFNRPGKGNRMPYTFFALDARNERTSFTRVLEARRHAPFSSARGYESNLVAGLPGFAHSTLKGEFPFVTIRFEDPEAPLRVVLEAYNPFIPLNTKDSGIPAGILEYRVTNVSASPLDVSVVGSLFNAVGYDGYDIWGSMKLKHPVENVFMVDDLFRGISMTSKSLPTDDLSFGSMALMTDAPVVTAKPEWVAGQWVDGVQDFWDDFASDGRLESHSESRGTISRLREMERSKVGSLALHRALLPGEEHVYRFVVAWHFPNRVSDWDEDACKGGACSCDTVRNYYSTQFRDAWHAGGYTIRNLPRLEGDSRAFSRAVFGSTLPAYVLDAMTCNLAILKSPTCFRIEDGTMLAYEGCHDQNGCCPGTCTHVWNYAQAMVFPLQTGQRCVSGTERQL